MSDDARFTFGLLQMACIRLLERLILATGAFITTDTASAAHR